MNQENKRYLWVAKKVWPASQCVLSTGTLAIQHKPKENNYRFTLTNNTADRDIWLGVLWYVY